MGSRSAREWRDGGSIQTDGERHILGPQMHSQQRETEGREERGDRIDRIPETIRQEADGLI